MQCRKMFKLQSNTAIQYSQVQYAEPVLAPAQAHAFSLGSQQVNHTNPASYPTDSLVSNQPNFITDPPAPCNYSDTAGSPSSSAMSRSASQRSGSSANSRRSAQQERSLRNLQATNERALNTFILPSHRRSLVQNSLKVEKRRSTPRKRDEKRRCELCPTLFSGEHERNRHFKLVHATEGWRWQIICPTEKWLQPHPGLKSPLQDCKNCCEWKLYGANYNAAAHLRRCHFKVDADTRNLAGNSGGCWPPIRYLEYSYMKLVKVEMISGQRGQKAYRRLGEEKHTELRPGKSADEEEEDGSWAFLSPASALESEMFSFPGSYSGEEFSGSESGQPGYVDLGWYSTATQVSNTFDFA